MVAFLPLDMSFMYVFLTFLLETEREGLHAGVGRNEVEQEEKCSQMKN